jgi:hypothetical protein
MTTDALLFSYLAGAVDADGYISIKRTATRYGWAPDFDERLGLKQVTPQVPELLRQTFGGIVQMTKPSVPNGRWLYRFSITNQMAARACEALLPYLRIKHEQAQLVLDLHRTKANGQMSLASYWFVREFPDWEEGELMDVSQVADALGYRSRGMVSQAIRNGTLVSLRRSSRSLSWVRVPKVLVERVASQGLKRDRGHLKPPQLVALRQELYGQMWQLNHSSPSASNNP